MPGLPGTPGRPGIDGKRGLPAKDGASGPKGDDGKKGDKGDAGANGKDGSKGEPGPPGLPGRQVLVTPEGATIDEIRQAFPIPMGPPGATGDKGENGPKGNKGDAGAPGKSVEMKDIEVMFEAYGIRLPLLKALIDRLLQDGIEELLHVLGTSKKTKENTQTHTSNVITEYTSSVKFDLTDQPLSELDTIEDPDLDGQLPESLSADPLNETGEGPTLWTVTTLNGEQELDRIETKLKGSRGKEVVDGNSDGASSLKMNLTVVNSTTSQETVSGLPETVVETVLLTQEASLKKNLGQKKKNRERGKTSEEDKQDEEEEFYNTEEYSYEYEEEVSTDDPSVSQERRDNRHLEVQTDQFPHAVDKKEEQLPTHRPAQLETLAETSSLNVALTNTGPLSQPMGDIDKDQDEVSLPTPPITTEEPDKGVP